MKRIHFRANWLRDRLLQIGMQMPVLVICLAAVAMGVKYVHGLPLSHSVKTWLEIAVVVPPICAYWIAEQILHCTYARPDGTGSGTG